MQSLNLAKKYGIYERFISAAFSGEKSSYPEGKSIIKTYVRKRDRDEWLATCIMYGNLIDIYMSVQHDVTLNIWYKVSNALPHLSDSISTVMTLIMGCQPKGMQHNFSRHICPFCDVREFDSACHVLFKCQATRMCNYRKKGWESIMCTLPPNIQHHLNEINGELKTRFILTGLGVVL